MSISSQALRPAKMEETVSHHQNNRCHGGRNLDSAKQLVYFANFSFNGCAEQSHKGRVRRTSC